MWVIRKTAVIRATGHMNGHVLEFGGWPAMSIELLDAIRSSNHRGTKGHRLALTNVGLA
jgi:hypothetical protein